MKNFVSTMFKCIIFVFITMFIGCITVEFCNISLYGTYINSYLRTSVRKSCEYICSESYREGRALVDIVPLVDSTGNVYDNGRFYRYYADGTINESETWDLMYDEEDFKSWDENIMTYDGSSTADVDWSEVNRNVYYYMMRYDHSRPDNDRAIGEWYRQALMSMPNMGIPYVGYVGDRYATSLPSNSIEVNNEVCRWVLASLLSSGNPEALHVEGAANNANNYVLFNGFKVYTNQFRITDTEYRLFDLSEEEEKDEFQQVTNMQGGTIYDNSQGNYTGSEAGRYAMTVALSFEVPVEYEGITPFKRLCSWILTGYGEDTTEDTNDDVYLVRNTEGFSPDNFFNNTDNIPNSWTSFDANDWSSAASRNIVEGGGYEGRTRFASSKVVYYIIH